MKKLKITEMDRLNVDQFKAATKIPLIIILDNIRSLHNVGSVFRTSDAFRIEKILLCGITATPPQAEIHKTALGAEDTVNWKYYENTLEAVKVVKNEGYRVCAIEQAKGSIMLNDFEAQKGEKIAIIMGNEVKGVQQEAIDCCDNCIEIPQYGTKHSLNVSITTGIVVWDLFNKISYIDE
jgi:tRNA G18 (ribose-2'-O)-methylase SpoU